MAARSREEAERIAQSMGHHGTAQRLSTQHIQSEMNCIVSIFQNKSCTYLQDMYVKKNVTIYLKKTFCALFLIRTFAILFISGLVWEAYHVLFCQTCCAFLPNTAIW